MAKEMKELMEFLDELRHSYAEFRDQEIKRQEQVVAEMDYNLKMDVVAWTMRKICEHARDGGTYRYLIYDRMGFQPDAYAVLMEAGGMEICNHFDLMDHE